MENRLVQFTTRHMQTDEGIMRIEFHQDVLPPDKNEWVDVGVSIHTGNDKTPPRAAQWERQNDRFIYYHFDISGGDARE